jgi:uncharacterized protein (DUF2252 family)
MNGRGIAIQIRDLDQTVIGNPAHDIIRLALSLATASRVTTAHINAAKKAVNKTADALKKPL